MAAADRSITAARAFEGRRSQPAALGRLGLGRGGQVAEQPAASRSSPSMNG